MNAGLQGGGGDVITHDVRVELPTHRDTPTVTLKASISLH